MSRSSISNNVSTNDKDQDRLRESDLRSAEARLCGILYRGCSSSVLLEATYDNGANKQGCPPALLNGSKNSTNIPSSKGSLLQLSPDRITHEVLKYGATPVA